MWVCLLWLILCITVPVKNNVNICTLISLLAVNRDDHWWMFGCISKFFVETGTIKKYIFLSAHFFCILSKIMLSDPKSYLILFSMKLGHLTMWIMFFIISTVLTHTGQHYITIAMTTQQCILWIHWGQEVPNLQLILKMWSWLWQFWTTNVGNGIL